MITSYNILNFMIQEEKQWKYRKDYGPMQNMRH